MGMGRWFWWRQNPYEFRSCHSKKALKQKISSDIFSDFMRPTNSGLIKLVGKCSFLLHFLGDFVKKHIFNKFEMLK